MFSRKEDSEYSYFNKRIWNGLASIEFENFDWEITDSRIEMLTAEVSFDGVQFTSYAEKKRKYLEAAYGGEISDKYVLDAISKDIEQSFGIILNRIGHDFPPEQLYEKKSNGQWKHIETEDYYSQYQDLLDDLTEDLDDIPSIPYLTTPFLQAVVESDEHELPPQGVVDDILSEHIESMRAERQSRKGVSKVKQELESRGVRPRTAASVANSVEEYLKTDEEIEDMLDED